MPRTITYDDLESALLWVSAAGPYENAACVSVATGEIYLTSSESDPDGELPADVEDAAKYVPVPHKNDLDLGQALALRFAEEYLFESLRTVQDYFHHRGAYARFKDLLERRRLLERWYEYEQRATEEALLAWAQESNLTVVPVPHGPKA